MEVSVEILWMVPRSARAAPEVHGSGDVFRLEVPLNPLQVGDGDDLKQVRLAVIMRARGMTCYQ